MKKLILIIFCISASFFAHAQIWNSGMTKPIGTTPLQGTDPASFSLSKADSMLWVKLGRFGDYSLMSAKKIRWIIDSLAMRNDSNYLRNQYDSAQAANAWISGTFQADTIISKSPMVDVRAFGAIPDDAIDDTDSIQAAINSITSGTVLIPAGEWNTSASLTIPAYVGIVGVGSRASRIVYSGTDYAIKVGGDVGALYYGCKVENLYIYTPNIAGKGITLKGTAGAVIRDIYIEGEINVNATSVGVHIDGANASGFFNSVENVLCNHINTGFLLQTTGTVNATCTVFTNCSSFGDFYSFPSKESVGFDFRTNQGNGSIILGGNIEACKTGIKTAGGDNRVTVNGLRFEGNGLDVLIDSATKGWGFYNCSNLDYITDNSANLNTFMGNTTILGAFTPNKVGGLNVNGNFSADGNALIGTYTPVNYIPKLYISGVAGSADFTTVKHFNALKLVIPTGADEYGNQAQFWLGRYEDVGNNARTVMTLSLGHNQASPQNANADADVMKWYSNGNVDIIGTSQAPKFISTNATGQPYAATSQTMNENLNAELLGGYYESDFAKVDTLDYYRLVNDTIEMDGTGTVYANSLKANIDDPTFTTKIATPTVNITTGAAVNYFWQCTNATTGAGHWAAVTESMPYLGTWNANTNTPTIADGTGTAGQWYYVTTAGTWNSITFSVNDQVMYNGSTWERIPAASITGAALTTVDDTNIHLTPTGGHATSLVNAAGLTVGWTGTLADGRIASASNWNAKAPGSGSANYVNVSPASVQTGNVNMAGSGSFKGGVNVKNDDMTQQFSILGGNAYEGLYKRGSFVGQNILLDATGIPENGYGTYGAGAIGFSPYSDHVIGFFGTSNTTIGANLTEFGYFSKSTGDLILDFSADIDTLKISGVSTLLNNFRTGYMGTSGQIQIANGISSDATWITPTTEHIAASTDKNYVTDAEKAALHPAPDLTGYELLTNKSTNTALGTSNTLYPTQNAVKSYVDNAFAGISPRTSNKAATTANLNAIYVNGTSGVGATLTNAGSLAAFAVDGVSPSVMDRILVKDQTTTYQNGIYTVTTVGSGIVAWVLTRAVDYDTSTEVFEGTYTLVEEGTTNAKTLWVMNVAGTITMGTTGIVFAELLVASQAHNSLTGLQGGTANEYYHMTAAQNTVIGNTSGTNSGDNATNSQYSGLVSNANHSGDATGSTALTLATVNSNIGTYNNITINGKGLATAGSNVSYLTSEVDGSTTNELQTIANTSDATSHTVTLNNSGGSFKLTEGTNVTMTTSGTGLDGVVTINASGGSGMVYPGAGIPVSSGSAWETSITNNSTNWNSAYTNIGKVYLGYFTTGFTMSPTYFTSSGDFIIPFMDSAPYNGSSLPVTSDAIYDALGEKENTLVSGTSIKTINSTTVLGSGNFTLANISGSLSQAFGVSTLNVEAGANDWAVSGSSGALNFVTYGGTVSFGADGKVTAPGANLSSETASTIASFDASKNIKSLSTATYPTLTELSYGKGVTSAIQTQFTGKASLSGAAFTGAVTNSSTFTATNFILSSDIRLKRNIKPIGFSNVDKIKFVQFEMKADSTHRPRFGVLAQQVERYMPELVYTDKETGKKSVAYIDLLVAKIAELENRIEKLESEKVDTYKPRNLRKNRYDAIFDKFNTNENEK